MALSKQMSIRMPADLAEQLAEKAKPSTYVIDAVREKIERDHQAEIELSLLCLADDAEANDISDFAAAQAKVMARGD